VRRSKTFNEDLSLRLKKPAYAKEFLNGLIEGDDGLSVEDALRQMIPIMGLKEFAEMTGVARPNLVAFVQGRRNLKIETLNQLLKPFKLKTKIVIEKAS
jgi:DNA-binding phage protein